MRRARRASLSFLASVTSCVRKRSRASCWVIVLAPCTTLPALRFLAAARSMPKTSTPQCCLKSRSSVAMIASTRWGDISSSPMMTLFSRKNSCRTSPFRSYTTVPMVGSIDSRREGEGRSRDSQRMLPTAATTVAAMTAPNTMSHLLNTSSPPLRPRADRILLRYPSVPAESSRSPPACLLSSGSWCPAPSACPWGRPSCPAVRACPLVPPPVVAVAGVHAS